MVVLVNLRPHDVLKANWLKSLTPGHKFDFWLSAQHPGTYPIELVVKVRIISFWSKLCCWGKNKNVNQISNVSGITFIKDLKLSFIIYRLCLQMSVADRCNCLWLNKIINILNECGMSNIWNTQTFLNSTWLINTVKLKLRDQFEQTWHSFKK